MPTEPATPALPPSVRNWLIAGYLADPTPDQWPAPINGPVVLVRLEVFTEFLLNSGMDVLSALEACSAAGWVVDIMIDQTTCKDPAPANHGVRRLGLPPGRHRLVGIRPAVLTPVRSESGTKGRKRGRRPADSKQKSTDIKLYEDWKGSALTKREFIRQRGIDADEGLASIDRGRKHSGAGK